MYTDILLLTSNMFKYNNLTYDQQYIQTSNNIYWYSTSHQQAPQYYSLFLLQPCGGQGNILYNEHD